LKLEYHVDAIQKQSNHDTFKLNERIKDLMRKSLEVQTINSDLVVQRQKDIDKFARNVTTIEELRERTTSLDD